MADEVEFGPETMGEFLNSAIHDHGFKVPIRVAVVAGNNATLVGYYEPATDGNGLDCRIVAEHVGTDGFAFPINIMYADREGSALHVVLKRGQKKPKLRVVN
jgi:hypothetical protein